VISLTILVTLLALGWTIRKLSLMALAAMRKAADLKPSTTEQAAAR